MSEAKIRIFVLDRGYVTIGRGEISTELAFHWNIKHAVTIRVWGTTEGLAELKDGPTANTVLDTPSHEEFSFRSVIKMINLTEKGNKVWGKILK